MEVTEGYGREGYTFFKDTYHLGKMMLSSTSGPLDEEVDFEIAVENDERTGTTVWDLELHPNMTYQEDAKISSAMEDAFKICEGRAELPIRNKPSGVNSDVREIVDHSW